MSCLFLVFGYSFDLFNLFKAKKDGNFFLSVYAQHEL